MNRGYLSVGSDCGGRDSESTATSSVCSGDVSRMSRGDPVGRCCPCMEGHCLTLMRVPRSDRQGRKLSVSGCNPEAMISQVSLGQDSKRVESMESSPLLPLWWDRSPPTLSSSLDDDGAGSVVINWVTATLDIKASLLEES